MVEIAAHRYYRPIGIPHTIPGDETARRIAPIAQASLVKSAAKELGKRKILSRTGRWHFTSHGLSSIRCNVNLPHQTMTCRESGGLGPCRSKEFDQVSDTASMANIGGVNTDYHSSSGGRRKDYFEGTAGDRQSSASPSAVQSSSPWRIQYDLSVAPPRCDPNHSAWDLLERLRICECGFQILDTVMMAMSFGVDSRARKRSRNLDKADLLLAAGAMARGDQ